MKMKYTTIIVKNIKESAEFYTKNFNLKIIEKYEMPGKISMIMLTDGDNVLELIENQEDTKISSIGFEVDDLKETVKSLERKKIEFINKPVKKDDLKIATFYDPNGLIISLSEKIDKST